MENRLKKELDRLYGDVREEINYTDKSEKHSDDDWLILLAGLVITWLRMMQKLIDG